MTCATCGHEKPVGPLGMCVDCKAAFVDRVREQRPKTTRRLYRAANADAIRTASAAARRRRRARERELPVEDYTREQVWAKTGGRCGICGLEIHDEGWQVDHIIPITWDDCPGDVLSNVQPAHAFCNNSKGNRACTTNADAMQVDMQVQCRPDSDLTRPDLNPSIPHLRDVSKEVSEVVTDRASEREIKADGFNEETA